MQTNARTVDADYVIIGGGITAALLAQKLSDLKPSAAIVVVEAGNRLMDLEARMAARQRVACRGTGRDRGFDSGDRRVDAIDGARRIGGRVGKRFGHTS